MSNATPPPVPPSPSVVPPPIPGTRTTPQSRIAIPGAGTMTPHEIKAAVDAGARFVFFQFCISALVITFKRPSPIYFLQPGEGTFVRQLPFTLISLVGGWWGIPWGPIWTISTTITNLSGGKDVTHEILARIGAPTTTTMGGPPGLAVSGLRKPGLSTAHKVLIGAAVTIALLAIIGMASLLINHADRLPRTPGEIEVRAAADLLGPERQPVPGTAPKRESWQTTCRRR